MPFQSGLDHVRLARGFFPNPDSYRAARPYLERMMRDSHWERISAVAQARDALARGEFGPAPSVQTMGNHYHGPDSWSMKGFRVFPAASAFISKLNGEVVTGKVDHYTMNGTREFQYACRAFSLPCTCGFEIRAWIREPLVINGQDLSGGIINAPGFPGMVYNVFHGETRTAVPFLMEAAHAKLERYERTTELINNAFVPKGAGPLNFERIRESASLRSNVLDKHVLGEAFDVLYDAFGPRASFDGRIDRMLSFVEDVSDRPIDRKKLDKPRSIADDQDREYAVFSAVIDIMRANLLSSGALGFIMPSIEECPPLESLSAIKGDSLLTYAILLRSAGGGEDPYFEPFLDLLFDEYGFDAASWMPNRNTAEESDMVREKVSARERLPISGMDVNKYLQNWVEAASSDPVLIRNTFILVGHEAAIRSGFPGLTSEQSAGIPFGERSEMYHRMGIMSDPATGLISPENYERARLLD